MNRRLTIGVFVVLLISLAVGAIASVPEVINYQGKLMQPSGVPVADGVYSMQFAIYDAPTGGTALWSETNSNVQVKGGIFSVLLGSVKNLPANVFDSSSRFFGMKVGSDPEMTPRQQMATVPFAVRADEAENAKTVSDGAITQTKLADGAITTTKLVDQAVIAGKLGVAAVTTSTLADQSVTKSKIADNAIDSSKLATASITAVNIADNSITATKLATEDWTPYTPVWASDSAPQPTNGELAGKYIKLGKTVIYKGRIGFVANTTFGSGRWLVSLPFRAKNDGMSLGVVRAVQYNTGNWVGWCTPWTSDALVFSGPSASTSSWEWKANVPFNWTANSYLQWEITYEAE